MAYGCSQFVGKLGQKIANEKVTAIDDGTIPNAWGSINIDDEGTPAQRNVLIENGILKTYMIDKFNGRRMGMASTGSARRQSYRFTTTSPDDQHLYRPGSGLQRGYHLLHRLRTVCQGDGGRLREPADGRVQLRRPRGLSDSQRQDLRARPGASLVGTGAEVIQKIDMVGRQLDLGQGMCGSSSGSIPHQRGPADDPVSNITVGGR